MNKCNICDNDVDFQAGGCAIMMAMCRKHTTNLINVAVCEDCYKMLVERPLMALNLSAGLNLDFGEGEQ